MFFNQRTYAAEWLDGVLKDYVSTNEIEQRDGKARVGAWCDDATHVHSGEKADGEKYLRNECNAKEYLETTLFQEKFAIPPGYPSRRPQDQRWINFLVQWNQ